MDFIKLAEEFKKKVNGDIKIFEPMSSHTTWRIGGPADLFFTPVEKKELSKGLEFAKEYKLPVTVIGGGSNILVRDEGIRGLVITTAGMKKMDFKGDTVVTDGGVKLPFLAQKTVQLGLKGLEFAAGIPGTVGGAVIMNAGAHGGSMADVVECVTVMNYQGVIHNLSKEDLAFSYRNSSLKGDNLIVIEVKFKLKDGDLQEGKGALQKNLAFRKSRQPWEYPNAGSVFKNPEGDSAGRLIDAVGAKGWKIGDAQVSTKHGNFIINLGNATCKDVLMLMEKIRKEVSNKFGVLLEPEILIMGG